MSAGERPALQPRRLVLCQRASKVERKDGNQQHDYSYVNMVGNKRGCVMFLDQGCIKGTTRNAVVLLGGT